MNDKIMLIGRAELKANVKKSYGLFCAVGLFSLIANVLMLTGPIYLMQIYDRVLGSKSFETLVSLSVIAIFLYTIMGILNFTRGRILTSIGMRFQRDLEYRVFGASLRKAVVKPDLNTQSSLNDLETVQKFMVSPVFASFFDVPWIPVFFTGIFIFHPLLGIISIGATCILILIAILTQILSRNAQKEARIANMQAQGFYHQLHSDADLVQGMGMREASLSHWKKRRHKALKKQIKSSAITSGMGTLSKTLRLLFQSAMIAASAYLVLRNEVTMGVMMASMILLARAMSPIDTILQQWALIQQTFLGWRNLAELLGSVPEETAITRQPEPKAHLKASSIVVVRPGEKEPALRGQDFEIFPGQALGVIGAAGAGKSTLAKLLTGVWRPVGGKLLLGDSKLDNFTAEQLSAYIGYLPQKVHLFDGSIRENISGFITNPSDDKIVKAAKLAGAHEAIIDLPNGYDTFVFRDHHPLSGGQLQSIGLARAIYNDPLLVVLDEPNSNLDNIGNTALNRTIASIKKRKAAVVIVTHRPAAIKECDMLMVIDDGVITEFGPRDEILNKFVNNHKKIIHDLNQETE